MRHLLSVVSAPNSNSNGPEKGPWKENELQISITLGADKTAHNKSNIII